jgi:hypothetical protein
MSNEWFPAHELVRDPKTRQLVEVVSENVVGRFITHPVIDGPASAEAKKNVYKDGIILLAKAHQDVMGRMSHDVSSHPIDETKDPDASEAAKKRFPEAWEAFQAAQPSRGRKTRKKDAA